MTWGRGSNFKLLRKIIKFFILVQLAECALSNGGLNEALLHRLLS